MSPEMFCYWLQGRLELRDEPLSAEETQIIREHLALVFTKITPMKMPGVLSPTLPYIFPAYRDGQLPPKVTC